MTRHFSEHSYQYIQTWLKTQLKINPEFKRKKDVANEFYNMKYKAQHMVQMFQTQQTITLLEEFALQNKVRN